MSSTRQVDEGKLDVISRAPYDYDIKSNEIAMWTKQFKNWYFVVVVWFGLILNFKNQYYFVCFWFY